MPNLPRLISLLGGPAKISRELGISESTASVWQVRGIPNDRISEILDMASGMADVARKTKTLVADRDGKSYGADAYIKEVRKALDVKICDECGQVVR